MINDGFWDFVNEFNIVDNALQMRNLVRWNGREIRNKENLAEHTHLVVTCVIELYDHFKAQNDNCELNFENIVKRAVLHDALELLRGDILSVTKDIIPGLRYSVDEEENRFLYLKMGCMAKIDADLVHLADLMACYKFIEYELRTPSNDFVRKVYFDTKEKYDDAYEQFCKEYGFDTKDTCVKYNKLEKGYAKDAGIDIFLDENVTFMPMSTKTISLDVSAQPDNGTMGIICSRSSAANKGLIVANCPIDPGYSGKIHAIVHNVSNEIITYTKGQSFCQIVFVPISNVESISAKVPVRKSGEREDGKIGSTGGM